jgi:hypothetical protein
MGQSQVADQPYTKGVFFLDTEFEEVIDGGRLVTEFISIGLTSLDTDDKGIPLTRFYGVSNEFNEAGMEREWIKQNVLAKLPPMEERQSLMQIREALLEQLPPLDDMEIWADHPYDFIMLRLLFGGHNEMFRAFKYEGISYTYFRDMNELMRIETVDFPRHKPAPDLQHIAIHDSEAARLTYLEAARALPPHLKAVYL